MMQNLDTRTTKTKSTFRLVKLSCAKIVLIYQNVIRIWRASYIEPIDCHFMRRVYDVRFLNLIDYQEHAKLQLTFHNIEPIDCHFMRRMYVRTFFKSHRLPRNTKNYNLHFTICLNKLHWISWSVNQHVIYPQLKPTVKFPFDYLYSVYVRCKRMFINGGCHICLFFDRCQNFCA